MSLLEAAPWLAFSPAPRRRSGVWLITFTDLVALMLAFFVMLFSMSTLDEAKWRQFAGIPSPDRIEAEHGPPRAAAARNIALAEIDHGRDLDYLATLLTGQLAAEPRLADAILRRHDDRIVISLPDGLLFKPNGATPIDQADAPLFALGGILRNLPNRIEIEGHTDPNPPDRRRYASNWELSLLRAQAVSAALQRAGYSRPMTVRGYGASRFELLSPRLEELRRNVLARRVDIVIHEAAEAGS
ncbi:OmpA/MotB family protein [Rhodospirillaceae bacterium SYSU D60014]|uniref:OmpA/MotB family protein n=1 Tax=Virgifigura deserti TaxID=2268457 RepID=UPI000E672B98